MISLDKINAHIKAIGLSKGYISKYYIGENGKPVSKQYIGQILNGVDPFTSEVYFKLLEAISIAKESKKNELTKKYQETIRLCDIKLTD